MVSVVNLEMSTQRLSSAPVPIPRDPSPPLPPVFAALGMAASYYTYPLFASVSWGLYFLFGILFLFALLIGFLRTLRFCPGLSFRAAKTQSFIRKSGILAIAAAAGFSLGFAARWSVPVPAETGLAAERIIAVSGILREDPRSFRNGTFSMGTLELEECAGKGGLRASAKGSFTVFFPPEAIPRLKEFGRGCRIYADGVLSHSERGPLFKASSLHIIKPAPAIEQLRTGLRITLLDKLINRQNTLF